MNNNKSRKLSVEQAALRTLLDGSYSADENALHLQTIAFRPFGSIAIFVSSSTAVGQTLNELMNNRNLTKRQAILKQDVITKCKSLGLKPKIMNSIGVWDDGNEEGVVIFLSRFCDQTLGDCLGSMIGKNFHQKVVMTYHDEPGGNDVIYRLSFDNGYAVSKINEVLDNAGIVNKTILLSPEFKHEAIILDEGRNLHDKLVELRNQHWFKIVYSKGTIRYLGHYDQEGVLTDIEARKKSGDVFNQIISTYFDSIEDVNVPESIGQYAAL